MSLEITCTRNEADKKQISRCKDELCPCDIADVLEMSVPAISQHIRKMKDVDLLTSRREGQTLYYSITPQRSAMLLNILDNIQPDRIAV